MQKDRGWLLTGDALTGVPHNQCDCYYNIPQISSSVIVTDWSD